MSDKALVKFQWVVRSADIQEYRAVLLAGGAELEDDILPFQRMKMRLTCIKPLSLNPWSYLRESNSYRIFNRACFERCQRC